jgi:hypothetical protein
MNEHSKPQPVEDPLPNPEPASPSLPQPDPAVYHHTTAKIPEPASDNKTS